MRPTCYQINLQPGCGGGEIYTAFFTKALLGLGWDTKLFVHPRAGFWGSILPPGAETVPLERIERLPELLPEGRSLLIFQTPARGEIADDLRRRHAAVCFAHMPQYGRDPEIFRHYDLIFAVSRHVIASLHAAGIEAVHAEPLYGVADLERNAEPTGPIRANSVYDWDRRKFRDRLLSHLYPAYFACKPKPVFTRKSGLTLGIVSRLTPIKQFPAMFELLAPIIANFPQVNLEIFGSGGYASVRDLERSLAPCAGQVRWWGHQRDVKAIYPQLDFLLTGLPEKEALGLNVIEAQACGTPVLAVDAAPFTETVVEGETGRLYADPRRDAGRDFARVLGELLAADGNFPDPLAAPAHLERFSFVQFSQRVERAMAAAARLTEAEPCS